MELKGKNLKIYLSFSEIVLLLQECIHSNFSVKNDSAEDIGFFPKWNRNSLNSANSGNLINHLNMNWAKIKDPVSHMCLTGAVVASWSLTQEVEVLNLFTVMTNIFVTEFSEFSENIQGKIK